MPGTPFDAAMKSRQRWRLRKASQFALIFYGEVLMEIKLALLVF